MGKASISILNERNIKNGKLAKLIPEFYDLKKVIENGPWHYKEPVFNHTLSVLGNLEKIIRNSKKEIKQALNKVVDRNSRQDLLRVAALLHDVGKKETIVSFNNIRNYPGHEQKGAKKAEKILRRFNVSQKEAKIITDIIRNHGVMHDIVGLEHKDFQKDIAGKHNLTHSVAGLKNKNFQKEYKNFKKKFSNTYLEQMLLVFADTVGSYLEKTKPAEFHHRINFYKKELKNFTTKNSKIKGIIFDADGLLYFRDKDVDDLKIELFKKFGYFGDYKKFKNSYEKEKWLGYVGKISNVEMFRKILASIGLRIDNNSLKKFINGFLKIHKRIKRVDGILETLKELKSNRVKIYILTDTFFPENEKWKWFKSIGLDKYIDVIVCSYDIKKLKDTKEAYEECLKRMKLKPSEVAFVGHKQYEMDGAKKVNIISIAILPISEVGIKADYRLQSIKGLPELISNIT